MRKSDPRYNDWLKRRLRKKAKKKHKKKVFPKSFINEKTKDTANKRPKAYIKENKVELVPSIFSLRENYDEVVHFFNATIDYMKSQNKQSNIVFDLSKVEKISADAVIYLLAVIKDFQKTIKTKHNFFGNMPKNIECKEFFIQSGFLNYVNSGYRDYESLSNLIQIESRNIYDQKVTKKICDFICEKTNCLRTQVKTLYVLINEMMLNTCQHAYDNDEQTNSWYLFVQYDRKFKFTFVDTGLGIPSTVNKKFFEKIFNKADSSIVTSALNGEFRTQTKNVFRGKGLPKIKECLQKHNLDNIDIITNKAYCSLTVDDKDVIIKENNIQESLRGTIYYWEVEL